MEMPLRGELTTNSDQTLWFGVRGRPDIIGGRGIVKHSHLAIFCVARAKCGVLETVRRQTAERGRACGLRATRPWPRTARSPQADEPWAATAVPAAWGARAPSAARAAVTRQCMGGRAVRAGRRHRGCHRPRQAGGRGGGPAARARRWRSRTQKRGGAGADTVTPRRLARERAHGGGAGGVRAGGAGAAALSALPLQRHVDSSLRASRDLRPGVARDSRV